MYKTFAIKPIIRKLQSFPQGKGNFLFVGWDLRMRLANDLFVWEANTNSVYEKYDNYQNNHNMYPDLVNGHGNPHLSTQSFNPDFSTPEFSTMNCSTLGICQQSTWKVWQFIPELLNPRFMVLKSSRLKSSRLKSLFLKSLELQCNSSPNFCMTHLHFDQSADLTCQE